MGWRAGHAKGSRVAATGVALSLALVVSGITACSGDSSSKLAELRDGTEPAEEWVIRPGVGLVTVSGAKADQPLSLYDAEGDKLSTVLANDHGQAHFAYVPDDPEMASAEEALREGDATGSPLEPGDYLVRDDSAKPILASEPFEVLARDNSEDPVLYESQELGGVDLDLLGNPVDDAELDDGFQYIEMRDGVRLSAMIRFPDRSQYGDGPWPTVIEYSGYGPSNPDSEEPGSQLARSFGYATVSVNIRGTGCSGGVFDTFSPAEQADGYDIVETVARQDWVLGHQVGMVGLSYSGITQLYTAAMRPPSLAAITPQSVIADPWLQQWPAGIYNAGFTKQWLAERNRASAAGGSEWVQQRIDSNDEVCAGNVAEHEMALDFEAVGAALPMRPSFASDRDLRQLVGEIEAPVFLTGAFQDEQTGPQFAAMLDNFEQTSALRVGLWNGRHPDGYSTMNLGQLYEFLEFYVAERVPEVPEALRAAAGDVVAQSFGFIDGSLPADRFTEEYDDDYDAALEAYEHEDPVRMVLGSGNGTNEVGEPGGTAELTFSSWPPPEAKATQWHLGEGGKLVADTATGPTGGGQDDPEGVDSFRFDPDAGSTTLLEDYSTLESVQQWNWTRFGAGRALAYDTSPLRSDLVVAGSGHLHLWVSANAADADVQVSISEIRPDGVEYLVQNGWLRLGHRAVDEDHSNELEVVHPFTADEYEELPDDEMVEAKVEIPAFGHVFGKGSRLRVTVSSPGRNHVTWTFEPPEDVDANTIYEVGRGGDTSSALVLPVVDVEVPPSFAGPAPCPGLRGMACRQAGSP